MQWAIAFFVAVFLICTCHSDERAAREAKRAEEARIEARIEQEVERRTEVARQELSEHADRLHNVRLVGFAALTIGSLAGLIWVRRPRFTAPVMPAIPVTPANRGVQTSQASGITLQPRPQWTNYHAPRVGRVIDLRPLAPSPPVQQPGQQRRVIQQQDRQRKSVEPSDGWIRRRRRRWNRDPDRQPNPPRRHHESSPRF